jgi:hypothetical protein
MECTFSDPVNISATSTIEQWQFSKMSCDDNAFLIENATTTDANFLIKKEFTYGDISIVLLTITFIFVVMFWLFRDLFFNRTVEIHTQEKKKF